MQPFCKKISLFIVNKNFLNLKKMNFFYQHYRKMKLAKLFLISFLLAFSTMSYGGKQTKSVLDGEDFLMLHEGDTTITTCGLTFYDEGGADGQYLNSTNSTVTFLPGTEGSKIQLSIIEFETESNYDYFKIYDGNNLDAPLLGNFDGTSLNSESVFISSAIDGSLTVQFTSDGTVTRLGWEASISCFTPSDADLSISGIISPLSTCTGYGENENITISIQNDGLEAQSNFEVSFSIIGTEISFTETVNETIEVSNILEYTFENTLDLSITGDYTFSISVDLDGDENIDNNILETSISVINTGEIFISGLEDSYCFDADTVFLTGTPEGGSFTGNGIIIDYPSTYFFIPSAAGVGLQEITYHYYDEETACDAEIMQEVDILALPEISFSGLGETADATALLQVYYQSYATECSWEILNLSGDTLISGLSGTNNSFSYNDEIEIPSGNYNFVMHDTYGDGWNGGYFDILIDNESIFGGAISPDGNAGGNGSLAFYEFEIIGKSTILLSELPVTLTGSPEGGTFEGDIINDNLFSPTEVGTYGSCCRIY
ncbi:MAG: hypothetical protein B6I24_07605 [Bacteroidetes bacterium 4572_128]|nr:MAG: hypothetical protein B6I24_07605 [Bacteroidetes bacterium 4572_128]